MLALATLGALLALVLLLHAASSPRLGFAVVWGTFCLVPYWLELPVGPTYLPPQSVAALVVLPGAFLAARTSWRRGDAMLLAFLVALGWAGRFGGTGAGETAQLAVQGGLGYLVGRLLIDAAGRAWVTRVVVWSGVALAVWSVAEYVTGIHVFQGLAIGPEPSWAAVLERSGHVRSEAAFGHPIVLGAVLALCVPLSLSGRERLRLADAVVLAVLFAGILTTVSRGPLLAAVLGLTLVVCFGGWVAGRTRVMAAVVGIAIAVPLALSLQSTLSESGQEATMSTQYRATLYSYVLDDVHPLSLADNMQARAEGGRAWRSFGSIDSTFIALALSFGWLTSALLVAALASVAWVVVRGRASVWHIAFLAQAPVLATVALITQYRMLVFVACGAVVALEPVLGRVRAGATQVDAPRRAVPAALARAS